MIRRVLLCLLCVALAACQGNRTPPPAATSYQADRTAQREQVKVAMQNYMSALYDGCGRDPAVLRSNSAINSRLSAIDDCAENKARMSLNFHDIPETACRQDRMANALACMLIGSAASRMIAAAGSDPGEVTNWSDPDASIKVGAGLLATRALANCGENASLSCVGREIGVALLLPSQAVDACATQQTGQAQGSCLATEFILDHIRAATLYLE